MAATLLVVSFLVFLAFAWIPGDPATAKLGTEATPAKVEALREEMGLNRPLPVRFAGWLGGLLKGDLGTSYRTRQPFTGEFFTKVPVTLKLGCLSFIVSSIVGISLGILSAVRQYSFADTFSTITAILFASIPGFFLGMVLIYEIGRAHV